MERRPNHCDPRAVQRAPHRLGRRPVLDARGCNSASTDRAAAQRRQRGHLHRLLRRRLLHHGILSTHLVPGNKGCLRYGLGNPHLAPDDPTTIGNIIGGVFVSVTGYYTPMIFALPPIASIGAGLMTTWTVES